MKFLFLVTLIATVSSAHAEVQQGQVQREVDGVMYNLYYDFDTADGECALRGKSYASSFYSMSSSTSNIAKLYPDGKVKELIPAGNASYEVIDGISCD